MENQSSIDHLFRHHYGKMVSILTRIFGLQHLETIEDAVQDTFVKAALSWRNHPPDNPEAWLTKAAKNRVLDLFRQIKASKGREHIVGSSSEAMLITELFLDSEIEDSQLRMIFTSCHPKLHVTDQIAFALRTISGFSSKEIASALLTKEETIKKRLTRARKIIKEQQISFKIPVGNALPKRLHSVLSVLYLMFNEGFHSNKQDILIRKDLCGEAMRLCQLLLKNKTVRNSDTYALFALMCFHAARLESKLTTENEIVDLKNQDRNQWYFPLIELGNSCMFKAVEAPVFSVYHYEAAIACEHLKASSFKNTNWTKIDEWYGQLYSLNPSPMIILNIAMVKLQLREFTAAYRILNELTAADFNQRAYLYYGAWAEYHLEKEQIGLALIQMEEALKHVKNSAEKTYLLNKKKELTIKTSN
ncbi:RNA polymerase sigma factor [Aquimarina agarilytica]|uniref:RNA polymerase sigma factor n=1 Tax=Aquimarina agarilytica TaxID=1087449 RepID=UPI000492DC82|nr:sigma-70 family RNA polymerase sigma factor [Aquimarina agarilytica]